MTADFHQLIMKNSWILVNYQPIKSWIFKKRPLLSDVVGTSRCLCKQQRPLLKSYFEFLPSNSAIFFGDFLIYRNIIVYLGCRNFKRGNATEIAWGWNWSEKIKRRDWKIAHSGPIHTRRASYQRQIDQGVARVSTLLKIILFCSVWYICGYVN